METRDIVCLLPTGFGKSVISVADPEIPKVGRSEVGGGTPLKNSKKNKVFWVLSFIYSRW
jgi:hypothetical protein